MTDPTVRTDQTPFTDPILLTDWTAAAGVGSGGTGGGPALWAAVAALFTTRVVVGELGDGQLEDRLRLLKCARSRLAAMDAEAVGELSRRRGEATAVDLLRDEHKQSRSRAKGQVKEARQIGQVPKTAQALADGAITPHHARLIAEAAEQVPPGAQIDEAALLAAARREPEDLFGRTVRDHLNELAGDDLEERRKRQRERRALRWKHQPDGMYELFGTFDPVTGARIETALTATANRLWHAEDPKNRATPQQRLADALELLVTGNGSGSGSGKAGTGAQGQGVDLLVIAEYDAIAGRLRDARLVDGTPLAPEELIRLACDAKILPALFDRKGDPLWLGRGKRRANARQRAVLAARDKGCIGCGASPNWCQAHHVIHWEHGGPTDIDNLCLLCSYCHHHQVHELGAEVVRDAHGRFGLRHPQRPPPAGNGTRREARGSKNRGASGSKRGGSGRGRPEDCPADVASPALNRQMRC